MAISAKSQSLSNFSNVAVDSDGLTDKRVYVTEILDAWDLRVADRNAEVRLCYVFCARLVFGSPHSP
jgi:hypothetical protein